MFGSELFDVPQDAARALLILPQPAEAHLSAAAPGADTLTADMAKTDRARAALLDLPGKPATQSPVSQSPVSQGTVTQRPGAGRSVTLQAAPGRRSPCGPWPPEQRPRRVRWAMSSRTGRDVTGSPCRSRRMAAMNCRLPPCWSGLPSMRRPASGQVPPRFLPRPVFRRSARARPGARVSTCAAPARCCSMRPASSPWRCMPTGQP